MGLIDFISGAIGKRRQLERAFKGREPLDDKAFWERYFKKSGVSEDTVSRVRRVLSEALEADLSRVRDTDSFARELAFLYDWDSFAGVDAVVGIEEEFGIKISDSEAVAMKTVRDVVLGVHRTMQPKKG